LGALVIATDHGDFESAIAADIGFDADQTFAKLIVVAGLSTPGEKATGRRCRRTAAEEAWIVEAGRSHASAKVAADVEAGPVINCGDRRPRRRICARGATEFVVGPQAYDVRCQLPTNDAIRRGYRIKCEARIAPNLGRINNIGVPVSIHRVKEFATNRPV